GVHDRSDITSMDATVVAGKRAFAEARLNPKDVQVAEVHDNFTISEILAIEDLRFVEKGKGGPATADGLTALNGKISVNTSGGLKARGQPVGATGVAQAVEIVRQLTGQAGNRKVVGARRGLTHLAADRCQAGEREDRDEGPGHIPEARPGRRGRRHPLRLQVPAHRLSPRA